MAARVDAAHARTAGSTAISAVSSVVDAEAKANPTFWPPPLSLLARGVAAATPGLKQQQAFESLMVALGGMVPKS
jgi:hypothetical protein